MAARSIDDYVDGLEGWKRDAALGLVEAVRAAAPEAAGSVKWAQPVFESNGPAVWIKAHPRWVSVGFWRGAELDDPEGRLEGGGDQMKHLKVREGEPIPTDAIAGYVRQAIRLNAEKGNPTARR